jgi:hypothetical protein
MNDCNHLLASGATDRPEWFVHTYCDKLSLQIYECDDGDNSHNGVIIDQLLGQKINAPAGICAGVLTLLVQSICKLRV